MGVNDIKNQIKKSLNKEKDEVFDYFDEIHIKSASIGQVHKAYIKNSNKPVTVKIQHPWLLEQVPLDIKITETFINIGNYLFKDFYYNWFVRDMKNKLPKEINFKHEEKNLLRIGELFKKNKNIEIPKYNSEI